jgi:hypothetical protein
MHGHPYDADAVRVQQKQIAGLQNRVINLETTLGALITWMAGSANSPIRVDEARHLLAMLQGEK